MQAWMVPVAMFAATAFGIGWVDASIAQTAGRSSAATAEATLSTDTLIGASVTNDAGEKIGTIDSLILDGRYRVLAVVVDVGGFLGIGAKQVELPMDRFVIDGGRVTLPGATKESLSQAREYRPASSALANAEVNLSGTKTRAEVDRTVREWRSKIDGFSQKAVDETSASYRSARDRLNDAWDRVEVEWDKVKSAGRESWADAQASFDEAVTELEKVWKEVAG